MIVLDTNALITFLDKKGSANYINLLAFLRKWESKGIALAMPSVSEYMAGDNNSGRSDLLLIPNSKFKNLDFDAKSALAAAKVYKNYRSSLPKHNQNQKPDQKVKVDIQILGIALANRASFIVTNDQKIKKIIERLGLSLQVFDYVDNDFYKNLTSIIHEENTLVQ